MASQSNLDSSIVEEMLAFLKGNKVTDSVSAELQEKIFCPVYTTSGKRLEDVLADAILNGRNVFVTGSAGGGKTTLVNRVENVLAERGVVVSHELSRTAKPTQVLIVKDLTAVPATLRPAIFGSLEGPTLLVAANVGALQGVKDSEEVRTVLKTLMDMQVGVTLDLHEGPVIVDMAAIDPLEHGLGFLLAHPLIHAAVELHEISEGRAPSVSLRVAALKQLFSSQVRSRVCSIVRGAQGPGEVTYRELWNFISDLFLGGTEDSRPVDCVWFWRLFYGDSILALSTSRAVLPNLISLPDVSRSLFKNARRSLLFDSETNSLWIDPGVSPDNDSLPWSYGERLNLQTWLRIQYSLVAVSSEVRPEDLFFGLSLHARGVNVFDVGTDASAMLQSLNSYFRRQVPEMSNGSSLELWIDLIVERRTDGSKALVSLGRIGESRFLISRSSAISNLDSVRLPGNRLFLQSVRNDSIVSTLEVNAALLLALTHGRASRISERKFSDVDFAIRKFFIETANDVPVDSPKVLNILSYDSGRESSEFSLDLDGTTPAVKKR